MHEQRIYPMRGDWLAWSPRHTLRGFEVDRIHRLVLVVGDTPLLGRAGNIVRIPFGRVPSALAQPQERKILIFYRRR